MGGDDDIADSLPRPPRPAPARRQAAIAEALRRFDGAGSRPARAAEARGAARPTPWWSPSGRPYAGALAGAFLVALVGLPLVWTSFDRYVADEGRERRPGVAAPAPEPPTAGAVPSAPGSDPPRPEPATKAEAAAAGLPDGAPAAPARAETPTVSARSGDEAPVGRSEEPAADAAAQGDREIVVTGSRIRQPNLESPMAVTTIGSDHITVTGSRASRAARRGDWNACTIEDPARNLARCRSSIDPAAKGARGRRAAPLADGLSLAWAGDLEAATAAFDRAIEAAPRSSAAYLNRGLAWRRRGDLDRALADLDQAVRHAPDAARVYYHRSLVLRQRGERRRARADEDRAVGLDPDYAALVGGGR